MACICGCDEENHLRDLPSRPASPNTEFEDFWAPKFVKVLTYRLDTVIRKTEPSRRFLWRRDYGGDAQDTAPPRHKWARPRKLSDKSLGCGWHVSRLPTPDYEDNRRQEQMVDEGLMQRRQHYSNNTGVAPEQPTPSNEEEESQTSSPPAKKVTHNSSVWSEEVITSPSSSNDLNQPVPDLSIKLASQTLPFWYDHGDTVSCTPPVHVQYDDPRNEFAVKRFYDQSHASQASRDPSRIKQEPTDSSKRKAEAADLEDRFETQKPFLRASTPNRCPCGCGEDATHCLRLNVPPPPKTFFENPLASNFTYMLDTRLDDAATRFEASRQTWRRPECDGCASDRKRSASGIRTEKSSDWENVLRTGPLPFDDVSKIRGKTIFQSSRNCQRSTRSLSAPIRSLDGLAKTPHFSRKSSPWLKREDLTVKKPQQLEQSCMHKLEPMEVERDCQVGVPLTRGRPLLAESPSLTFQGDNIKKARSSIKAMMGKARVEHQDRNQSTSPKIKATILRRNSWHGTASDRHDSLDTEFLPSTSHDLEVEDTTPNFKDLTKDFAPDQRRQSLYHKIEALKMRRDRRQGIALYRHDDPAVETSSSALQVGYVEEISRIERKGSTIDETQRLQ